MVQAAFRRIEDGIHALDETVEIQVGTRKGNVVEGGGKDVDVLGDVQLLECVVDLLSPAAGDGGLHRAGKQALDRADISLEHGLELAQHRFQTFFPQRRREEAIQVGIDAGRPGLELRFRRVLQIRGQLFGIGSRGVADGVHDGRLDNVVEQFLDRSGNGDARGKLIDHPLEFVGDVVEEGLPFLQAVKELVLDGFQEIRSLLDQVVVQFLQEIQDLPDGDHERLHRRPEFLLRLSGQRHHLVRQALEEGFQQVADGPEIRDVGIEEPGDSQDLVDKVLGVLQGIHRVERLEVADRGGEHPFDPPPTEDGDIQGIGEVGRLVDELRGLSVDHLAGRLDGARRVGQVAADESHLLLERRDAEGGGFDQVARQFQVRAQGLGNGLAGILRQGLGILEAAADCIAHFSTRVLDGGEGGRQIVSHSRTDRLQTGDEALRKLERHFLLAYDAQEIEDGIGLAQSFRNLLVDALDPGVFQLLGGFIQLLARIGGEAVIDVFHLAHAVVEERLREHLRAVGRLPDAVVHLLERFLDLVFDIVGNIRNPRVNGVRLHFQVMDLVGEDFLAVPEQRDQDMLDHLLDEALDIETVRKIRHRIRELSGNLARLDIAVALDQFLDVIETVLRRRADGGVIDILDTLGIHNRRDGVFKLVHQGQAVGDKFAQLTGLCTVADIESYLGKNGIDDLVSGFQALPDIRKGRSGRNGLLFAVLCGFPDSGELFFQILDQAVFRFLKQKQQLVGDIGEFHRRESF